mmetsp:Transcript_41233/g.76700  ORF Transcript_41233/g.76700 Transcript_41233/m.76700 type:complete len:299 (-) Transcript_41233:145-1041(-)
MPRVNHDGGSYPAMAVASTIKAGPKFSFGTAGLKPPATPRGSEKEASVTSQASPRGRLPVRGLETPGPGAYEAGYLGRRPSTQANWPFGCSTATGRFVTPEPSPGPGDYEAKLGSMHVQQIGVGRPQSGNGMEMPGFGSSTARKIVSSPRSPSPTASVSTKATQPQWTGGTPTDVGPGSYEAQRLSLARAAGAKFAAARRFDPPDRTSSPGPGEYDPPSRRRPMGHRFPNTGSRQSVSAQSTSKSGTSTPGPAAYDTVAATQTTAKRMPGYSMRGRPKEVRETSPGPADYGGAYTLFR